MGFTIDVLTDLEEARMRDDILRSAAVGGVGTQDEWTELEIKRAKEGAPWDIEEILEARRRIEYGANEIDDTTYQEDVLADIEEEQLQRDKLLAEQFTVENQYNNTHPASDFIRAGANEIENEKKIESTYPGDVLADFEEGRAFTDRALASSTRDEWTELEIKRAKEQVPWEMNPKYPIEWQRNPNCVLPPRVYVINGINSAGPVLGTGLNGPDDDSFALEKLLEAHGYDPNEVVALQAIYTRDPDMHDALTTIVGGAEVLEEFFDQRNAYYTTELFEEIQDDLQDHPLAEGQCTVIGAHSGGGGPAPNLAGMIEDIIGVEVEGIFTMGSPVSDYYEARRYAEQVIEFRHEDDYIGLPIIRSSPNTVDGTIAPSPIVIAIENNLALSQEGVHSIILEKPVTIDNPEKYGEGFWSATRKAHASYMHDPINSNDLLEYLNDAFGLGLDLSENMP